MRDTLELDIPAVLEAAVLAVSEHAATADAIVAEAIAAGFRGDHPITIEAKMLRLDLLRAKADLEGELSELVLDCSTCRQTVHWVTGLGVSPGQWAHREPAPHGEPVLRYRRQ